MDPKQWFTEHKIIQGMSGPLELRRQCNHLTEKNCHSMKCPSGQKGDVHRGESRMLGTKQVGMCRSVWLG